MTHMIVYAMYMFVSTQMLQNAYTAMCMCHVRTCFASMNRHSYVSRLKPHIAKHSLQVYIRPCRIGLGAGLGVVVGRLAGVGIGKRMQV